MPHSHYFGLQSTEITENTETIVQNKTTNCLHRLPLSPQNIIYEAIIHSLTTQYELSEMQVKLLMKFRILNIFLTSQLRRQVHDRMGEVNIACTVVYLLAWCNGILNQKF